MINIQNLSKIYSIKKQNIKAIDSINIEFYQGEITGLLGQNGAGKTTLLKMLSGLLVPTSGKIFINNTEFTGKNIELKEKIGFVSDIPFFNDKFTVNELLFFCTKLVNNNINLQRSSIEYLIETFSLQDVLEKKISTLSKGYKQRLSFAQTMASDPDILLLDEPLSGLDPIQINQIRNFLVSIKENKTIILSTHILQEINILCDKIVIIDNGKILASGNEKQICDQTKTNNTENAFYQIIQNNRK